MTGEGLTPLNLQTQPNQRGLQGQLLPSSNNLINNPESQNRLLDLVDISEQARTQLQNDREAIGTLIKGRGVLEHQQIDLLKDQLNQISEQIDFIRNLLGEAEGEQRQTLLRAAEQAAEGLDRIGRQIGLIDDSDADLSIASESVSVTAVSLTASFNTVATVETADGDSAEFRQRIDIEFSFLNISAQQSRVALEPGQEGSEALAQNTQQSSLILAQASVAREQTITVQSGPEKGNFPAELASTALRNARDPFSQFVREFSQTAKDFRSLVEEFQHNLSDEERIPPSIISVIKKLVSQILSGEKNGLFNQSV